MDESEHIRVMRIIARLNIGGPARYIAQLAWLDPSRFETLLVVGRPGPHEGDMADLLVGAPGRLVYVPELGRRIAPWDDLTSLVKIVRLMREFRPHIVETHTAKAGALGRLAAWITRVPVVIHTFHGHVFRGYWNAAISRVFVLIERWLARCSDRLVAVSERIRQDLLEFNIADPGKVVAIPLGFALDEFASAREGGQGALRAELGVPAGEPLIGNVGRLVPIKNQALFVSLAQRWVAAGNPGHFAIVGDGVLRAQLAAQIEEAGLSGRVHLLGWRRDLPVVYGGLDAIVNTSNNEGTPVAIIEAMAAGVPVVATAVGGVPDMIEHDRTGWLAAAEDVEGLQTGLHWALEQPQRALAVVREQALAQYSHRRLLGDIDRLYTDLMTAAKIKL